MKMTIRVRLEPSPAQAAALADTRRVFTVAFNLGTQIGWAQHITNATKLHYAAYYAIKAACPTLVSDLINQARVKAAEAVRSAYALQAAGRKASPPRSQGCPPRYNKNTYRVDWESRTVRVSTTQGRQTIRFRIPPAAATHAGYPVDTADLIFRQGHWWLHVVVTVPAPEVAPTAEVMGVDLGLAQPAATSTNKFLGAKRWRALEDRMFKLRRALQKKGTKSARRHLHRIKGRQVRFRHDCDHVLSKRAVRAVEPGATIVIENLKDIRKRTKIKRKTKTARRVHSWTFAQFKGFLAYKAEERGCTVAAVDPRHTSQACSRCGHIVRNNRRSRARFCCRLCGFDLHADLNAARNIAAKYRAGEATRRAGGLPVNQPIVSVHGDSPQEPGASSGSHAGVR